MGAMYGNVGNVGEGRAKPWQWERRTVVRLGLPWAVDKGPGHRREHNDVTQDKQFCAEVDAFLYLLCLLSEY